MRSYSLFAFLSLTAFAALDLAAPLPASGDRMPAGERAELIFERPNPVPPWAPTTYTTSSSTSTSASSGSSTGMSNHAVSFRFWLSQRKKFCFQDGTFASNSSLQLPVRRTKGLTPLLDRILIRLDNHMDHNVDDNLDHDLDGHRDAVYHPRR